MLIIYSIFPDAPTILPESSCSLKEDLVRCFCHTEAFPNASISWDFDENYSLPSSFNTIYTIRQNVVSGEMSVLNQGSVWCKAWNEFGSDTKQLFFNSSSKTGKLFSRWLFFVYVLPELMTLNIFSYSFIPYVVMVDDRGMYSAVRLFIFYQAKTWLEQVGHICSLFWKMFTLWL